MAILFTVLLPLLMAGLAKSNESVVAIGQVVQFPMMLLSGVLFPLEMLPDFLRPVSAAIPLTYLSDGLKQTMLGPPRSTRSGSTSPCWAGSWSSWQPSRSASSAGSEPGWTVRPGRQLLSL